MSTNSIKVGLFIGIFLLPVFKLSAEGVLPRGKPLPDKVTRVTTSETGDSDVSIPRAVSPCFNELFNYPGRKMVFSQNGAFSYHLIQGTKAYSAPKTSEEKDPKANPANDDKDKNQPKIEKSILNTVKSTKVTDSLDDVKYYASTLYKFDNVRFKLTPIKSGPWPKAEAFVIDLNTSQGLVLVSFVPGKSACLSGEANLYYSQATSNSKSLQFKTGKFSLVESSENSLYLYDQNWNQLVEVEPNSFQLRKILFPFNKSFRPLFYKSTGNPGAFVWRLGEKGRPGGLAYIRNANAIAKKVSFLSNDLLIQNGRYFAAVRKNISENVLEIQELSQWSGSKKQELFKIKLPKGYLVNESTARIRLNDGKIILLGQSEIVQKRWRRVFIYDYKISMNPVAVIQAQKEYFIDEADFHPGGKHVIANVKHHSLDYKNSLYIYSFKLKKTRIVNSI